MQQNPSEQYELNWPEPAFRHFSAAQLTPRPADRSALSYLTARVVNNPADLLTHTQRVLVACSLADTEHVFGGLVDLYLITGGKAQALRGNLLKRCRKLLSEEQHRILVSCTVDDLAADCLPNASCSLLSKGFTSRHHALVRHP